MAGPAGLHFSPDHTRGWSEHIFLRTRHRESRASYGNHMGFEPHRAHAEGSFAAAGGFDAVHRDGSGGGSSRTLHELVHAATGREQASGGSTHADFPWTVRSCKVDS